MKATRPGVYEMTHEEYHSANCTPEPALSSTGAVSIMRRCPAYFWWNSALNPVRPDDETPNKDFGSAAHIAMLEPDLWASRVAIIQADNWRTKAAQEARIAAYAEGKIPLLPDGATRIVQMRAALDAHPVAGKAFTGGKAEQSLIWQDRSTGVWCKARPDYMRARANLDYKTVASAHPGAVERHVYEMGYHQQAAWYIDGRAQATGEIVDEHWLVCQERDAPFLVSVCRLAGDAIEWGAKLNRRALDIFAECLAAGEWPGYRDHQHPGADRAFVIGLPAYAAFQLAEREEAGELRPRKPPSKLIAAALAAQAPLEEVP